MECAGEFAYRMLTRSGRGAKTCDDQRAGSAKAFGEDGDSEGAGASEPDRVRAFSYSKQKVPHTEVRAWLSVNRISGGVERGIIGTDRRIRGVDQAHQIAASLQAEWVNESNRVVPHV